MMDMVIMMPDWVSKVIYHMIAYWTSEEPNNEMVWLVKNRAVFFFQELAAPLLLNMCATSFSLVWDESANV